MERGKFIVFEGINGCGKGTQLNFFHEYLLSLGKAVPIFTTGEPNDFDENGRLAREMLRSEGDPYSNSLEAVRYFAENRGTHNKLFVPLLERGVHVLSDRYWHSNFAFQHAQGIPYEEIARANEGLRVPDLTIILDVSVETSMQRLSKRDAKTDRRKFDRDKIFLKKVATNYLELPLVLRDLMGDTSAVIVNGDKPLEKGREVSEEIIREYSFISETF